jgi:hypothetical protein
MTARSGGLLHHYAALNPGVSGHGRWHLLVGASSTSLGADGRYLRCLCCRSP